MQFGYPSPVQDFSRNHIFPSHLQPNSSSLGSIYKYFFKCDPPLPSKFLALPGSKSEFKICKRQDVTLKPKLFSTCLTQKSLPVLVHPLLLHKSEQSF